MRQRGTHIADRLISFFQLSPTIPETKRRVFLTIQTIGILGPFGTLLLVPWLALDWFNIFANILMLVLLSLMTVFLWRHRERQELILFFGFFGSAAWLLMILFYNLVQTPPDVTATSLIRVVSPWFIWIIIIYMVSFLTFRAASACRMSLLISILFMMILAYSIWRVGTLNAMVLHDFLLLFVANLFVIFIAFPLAQAQENTAQTDFLTSLKNRHRGYSMLVTEIERAQRYNEMFSIILFDIDHFKKINDTCGHLCGDAVLREVAAFTGEHIRRTDLLCRWGGEEFLLVMTHTDLASAKLKADHLRQQLKNRPFHTTIHLTASFGVTAYYPYDSPNTMLERADQALYRAKRNGRNCVETE